MSEAACQATGEAATVHCRACQYYSSMLRPFLQHIEAFFGQEIREISCKAIFDFYQRVLSRKHSPLDFKLPATMVLGEALNEVPESPIDPRRFWRPEHGDGRF
jgi:hypothetical protein